MAQCTADAKSTGVRCTQPAIRGGTVCNWHGGAAPQVRAKANGRLIEQQARAQLARLDVPPVEDHLTELAKITGQVIAWKDQMAGVVNNLTSLRYEGTGSGEQLRAELALWERALDRCERFLTAMARLEIDDRLARITEARATVIIAVFLTALDAAGVQPELRDAVLAAADAEFARQAGVIL